MLAMHTHLVGAYTRADAEGVRWHGMQILELMLDLDEALGTSREWLLGRWLADARHVATSLAADAEPPRSQRTSADAMVMGATHGGTEGAQSVLQILDFNARNQVTLWGPNGEISDYASKQWSGLIRAYYAPRWEMFIHALERAARAHANFDESAFARECGAFERSWQHNMSQTFPDEPQGDPIAAVERLHAKYSPMALLAGGSGV